MKGPRALAVAEDAGESGETLAQPADEPRLHAPAGCRRSTRGFRDFHSTPPHRAQQ